MNELGFVVFFFKGDGYGRNNSKGYVFRNYLGSFVFVYYYECFGESVDVFIFFFYNLLNILGINVSFDYVYFMNVIIVVEIIEKLMVYFFIDCGKIWM